MPLVLMLTCLIVADASSPEDRLTAAQADLEALKLEDAQAALEQLVADPAASEPVRAKAWLTLGLTRASLLDDDGARVAFAAALTIDSKLALPADSSPKVQRMFEKIRARLPAVERAPTDGARPASTTPTSTTPGAAASGAPASGAPASGVTASGATASGATAAGATASGATAASPFALPLLVGGGVALVLAAGAGVGALLADNALATPEKGRTRPEYDAIRNAGIAGVVGAAALGVAGGALLAAGVAQ